MEKIKIFTFPNDKEMEMKQALGFFECYRSPKEVEELKGLLDSMDESSRGIFIKNLMPLMLIADVFGAPKYLMDDEKLKEKEEEMIGKDFINEVIERASEQGVSYDHKFECIHKLIQNFIMVHDMEKEERK